MAYAALRTSSSANGSRRLGQPAVAVVLAVDAQRVEAGGEALYLAQEVGGREPALAELARQGVGGGGERHARVDQLAEQGGDQDRVARVVQLELVDAQEAVAGERLDRLLEAEGADQVGQLDEGAEGLEGGFGGGGVPERGQQVGLADAVAAVEVDAARACRGLGLLALPERLSETEEAALAAADRVRAGEARREAREDPDGLGLAGLVRVRDVRVETHRVEPRRRHHLGDQPVRGDVRLAVAQGERGGVGHGAEPGRGGGSRHGSPC